MSQQVDTIDLVEVLARELHAIYQQEARRQAGVGEDDVRHPDDYDQLAEHTKDYDRVLARFILEREGALLRKEEEHHQKLLKELTTLRMTAREFLDASNAAAKPMDQVTTIKVMQRWQRAGAKLRELVGYIVTVHDT